EFEIGGRLRFALHLLVSANLELLELEDVQVHDYRSLDARRIRRTSLTAASTMASRSSAAGVVPADPAPLPSPSAFSTTARITSSLISTGMVISSESAFG